MIVIFPNELKFVAGSSKNLHLLRSVILSVRDFLERQETVNKGTASKRFRFNKYRFFLTQHTQLVLAVHCLATEYDWSRRVHAE